MGAKKKEVSEGRRKFMKTGVQLTVAAATGGLLSKMSFAQQKPTVKEMKPVAKMELQPFETKYFSEDFQTKLITDPSFLKAFCEKPAETLIKSGIKPPAGLPARLDYDAASKVTRSILRNWGSAQKWVSAHANVPKPSQVASAVVA